MKEAVIINAVRAAYSIDQIDETLTVGQLIRALQDYDEDLPVYLGHDKQSNGSYYTFGYVDDYEMEVIDVDENE